MPPVVLLVVVVLVVVVLFVVAVVVARIQMRQTLSNLISCNMLLLLA